MTSDLAPLGPAFITAAERDPARRAVTQRAATKTSTETEQLTDGTLVVNPLLLPDELQERFARRSADGYRVPVAVEKDHRTHRPTHFTYGLGDTIYSERHPEPARFLYGPHMLLPYAGLAGIGFIGISSLDIAVAAVLYTLAAIVTVVSATYGINKAVRSHRTCQAWERSHERYGFTSEDRQTIRAHAVRIPAEAPEIVLAAVAQECVDTILAAEAWNDPILDTHRLRFNPEHEATEIRSHALNIAALRIYLGDRDLPTDTTVTAARRDISSLTETLTDRVAALWAYTEKIDKLSEPIRDLRAIRSAIDALPAIDTIARQMGVDELATRELQRLTTEADTITITVEELAADLNNRLIAAPSENK